MAARMDTRDRARWREHGIDAIAVDVGLDTLRRALAGSDTTLAALPVRWDRFLAALGEAGTRPFFDRVRPTAAGGSTGHGPSAAEGGALARSVHAAEPRERIALARTAIERAVRAVLALDGTTPIPPATGFTELGMDSLMAVELANRLAVEVGARLPTTLAFENPTPAALAEHLVELITGDQAEVADRGGPEHAAPRRDTATPTRPPVDELTEEEAEDTLLRALERAGY
jgi:acyl carrier protein